MHVRPVDRARNRTRSNRKYSSLPTSYTSETARSAMPYELPRMEYELINAMPKAVSRYLKRYPHTLYYRNEILYHYTDLQGLLGILSNRGFWLSDVRFLNDDYELIDGAKRAVWVIEQLLRKQRYQPFTAALESVRTRLSSWDTVEAVYVCSFSLTPDSLEQWRAYGANGSGVCIGFDVGRQTAYPHFLLGNQWDLQEVIYDDRAKDWIILSIIHSYFFHYKLDVRKMGGELAGRREIAQDYAKYISAYLVHLLARFKNASYQSEQEVRLIDGGRVDSYKTKRHRIVGTKIVPYLCTFDLKFNNHEDEETKPDNLPVHSIIVGPTARQSVTVASIRSLLSDLGLADVEVVPSRIPYRG